MALPRYIESYDDVPGPDTLLSMSGLEFMQAMLAGQLPHPAIAKLMGIRAIEVGKGRALFGGRPTIHHTNPIGAVHGGWYGTLLDTALGCAVMTVVPKGRWYTTLEYKVNLTRALPPETEVQAEGTVDHAGKTTAVAHAEIRDLAGKLYATGTTTCIILGDG